MAEAHIKLSSAINEDGVLDEKTRSLNLVGIHSTTRNTIALRHFTRMSSIAGASKEEIQAAALPAYNTGVSSAELSIPRSRKSPNPSDPFLFLRNLRDLQDFTDYEDLCVLDPFQNQIVCDERLTTLSDARRHLNGIWEPYAVPGFVQSRLHGYLRADLA